MGLATARLLGRRGKVMLCDLDADAVEQAAADLRTQGVDAESATCDITDKASVDEVLRRASDLGDVRSIVHTAGLSPLMGSADRIIRVNALGTVNVVNAAHRVASPDLAVVLVASIAGHLLPRPFVPMRQYKYADTDLPRFAKALTRAATRGPKSMHSASAYSISKNFVIWYAKNQAKRFGARSSRILSVSPGSFDTTMGRLEIQNGAERILQFAALPRFGHPEEIAELLAFCASERASYLTGTDILCDGGTVAGTRSVDLIRTLWS
jgi:NAD(P)-dependent dehydrogenase (short-subunit alcohol dehydrogenase family)